MVPKSGFKKLCPENYSKENIKDDKKNKQFENINDLNPQIVPNIQEHESQNLLLTNAAQKIHCILVHCEIKCETGSSRNFDTLFLISKCTVEGDRTCRKNNKPDIIMGIDIVIS